MAIIRAMIIDDEPLAREGLRNLLEFERDIEVIGESSNGTEAVSEIREKKPDLVFLDVQMPGFDGLEVLEEVGIARMPIVIFVTAHDDYAVKAFEASALDYLLKPIDEKRFSAALERVRHHIQEENTEEFQKKVLGFVKNLQSRKSYLNRLAIRSSGRVSLIDVETVDWIEAAGDYVRVHCGQQNHLMREKMNVVELELDPGTFVRIHRSVIVNILRVKELRSLVTGDYTVLLDSGKKLTLSRKYKDRLPRILRGIQ